MRLTSLPSSLSPASLRRLATQNASCRSMTVLGATTRSQQTFFLCGTPVHGATYLPCQVQTRVTFMTRCAALSVDRKCDARASMQPYAGRLCSTSQTWSNTRVYDSRATSSTGQITDGEDEGVSLGTMEFSGDVDLKLFQSLLFQASMITILFE